MTNPKRFHGAPTRGLADLLSVDDEARFEDAAAVVKRWATITRLCGVSKPLGLVATAASDISPTELARYLLAVDEIIRSSSNSDPARIGVLRIAIYRLKHDFRHLVIEAEDGRLIEFIKEFTFFSSNASAGSSIPFTPSCSSSFSASSSSTSSYSSDLGSSTYERYEAQASSFLDKEYCNPIGDGDISSIRKIVDRIVRAGYRSELCELFIENRLCVVKNRLALLGLGCINIKDDKMVRNWILALKVVHVIFAWETKVCHQIFAAYDELREECSVKVTEHCALVLLESTEMIANLPRNTWRILDLAEMLMNAESGLLAPFSGASRETISGKLDRLFTRLMDAVVKYNPEVLNLWKNTTDGSLERKQSRDILRIAIMSRLKDRFQYLMIAAEAGRLNDFIQKFTSALRVGTCNDFTIIFPSSTSASSSSTSFFSSIISEFEGTVDEHDIWRLEEIADSFLDEENPNPIGDEDISSLKNIVDRILRIGYRSELCELFIKDRLCVVKKRIALLGLGSTSIKDNKMVRNWILALNVVHVIFSWETWVCHQIFAAYDELREECSVNVIEHCVIELLESAEAIANLQRNTPHILHLRKTLQNAESGLLAPFSGASKESISRKLDWLITGLTDAAHKYKLEEIWNTTRTETDASLERKQSSDIHQQNLCLTRECTAHDSRARSDVLPTAMSGLKDEFPHLVSAAEDSRLHEFIQTFVFTLHVGTGNTRARFPSTSSSSSSSSASSSSSYGSSSITSFLSSIITLENRDLLSLEEMAASFLGEEYSNPICNGAIYSLRERVDQLVRAGYSLELCDLFIKDRRFVVENRLALLGLGHVSIEEDKMIQDWILALKVVRVVFSWEAWVCNHIFADYVELREECFVKVIERCIIELLESTEMIATGLDISRALHLYENLMNAQSGLLAPLSGTSWQTISGKLDWLVASLTVAVKCRLQELGNEIQTGIFASWMRTKSSDIHQQTFRLMYKLASLVDYTASINVLLHDECLDATEGGQSFDDNLMTPFGRHALRLISYLEAKLEEISKFYEQPELRYIFMVNNIWYIVKRVSNSKLKALLGDDWVQDRQRQIEHYVASYLTTSWDQVTYCLEEVGMRAKNNSGTVSRVKLRKGIKKFNSELKEICKIQTVWKVPDPELRGKLRKALCDKLIPAYKLFLLSFGSYLDDKKDSDLSLYTLNKRKFTAEELEVHLSDIFEGSFLHCDE